jgi:hypothetical protein
MRGATTSSGLQVRCGGITAQGASRAIRRTRLPSVLEELFALGTRCSRGERGDK